jgi:ABC-2 type transport system ATP-binding protein
LPTSLLPMLKSGENGVFTLALTELNQVEFALSELRKTNVKVDDMQLLEADLEDVFMSLVGSK